MAAAMRIEMARQLKILLSAYACEPGRGSEPEVGWRVATEMAKHCSVQVITRANNRELIEAELSDWSGTAPVFLYYDLPSLVIKLKKTVLGTGPYYFLWQMAVRWKFRKILGQVDLVHHLTFNGFQVPGFWFLTETPVVLGPLGGGMGCPKTFLDVLKNGRRRESLRSLLIRYIPFLPWWKAAISNASLVLAANRETAKLLHKHCHQEVEIMLETAIPEALIASAPHEISSGRKLRFLWLGNLIPRKAPILAVRALHRALESTPDIELIIAGAGPEESRLRDEVRSLGMEFNVTFLGRVPKADVERLMDEADAFVFTSVRDTSGNVVLEAMSRGLPVIALWHQGAREICDSECALIVPPSDIAGAIDGIAEAMIRLRREEGLADRIGQAGTIRIRNQLTWETYGQRMFAYYVRVINMSGSARHLRS
jgi:glycosyltransferase involved in cell wall biosynthesis